MRLCAQRTIQELFEVCTPTEDTGFPVKAEEFVVLPQEPTVTETIAPKIARPFIEVSAKPCLRPGLLPPVSRSRLGGALLGSTWGPAPLPRLLGEEMRCHLIFFL